MRSRMSPLEMLAKEFKGIVVYRKVHSETLVDLLVCCRRAFHRTRSFPSLLFCYVLPSPASGSRLWSVLSATSGVYASQWWIPRKHEYDGSLPLQCPRGVCCAPAAALPGESCWNHESCCNTRSELPHYPERRKQGESEWIRDCPKASRKRGGKGVWLPIRLFILHSVKHRRGSARACRTSRARPYRTRRRTRRTTFCT